MDDAPEFLFPPCVIPSLRDLRSEAWRSAVDEAAEGGDASVSEIAFVHVMVELNGCITCNADSFRAMRGCRQCSSRNLRRAHLDDADLAAMYARAKELVAMHPCSSVLVR